jgi:glycerol-3-phosphate O-acyltransferase
VSRIAAFMNKLMGLDAACVIRFGQPVDCFGNPVDEEGVSHDTRGRAIDPLSYVMDRNDAPVRDAARDAQYTRELGEVICESYKRDTVVMSTHLAAAAAFDHLRHAAGHADLDALLDRVRHLEARGGIVLANNLRRADGAQVLDDALRAFAGYHTHEVLAARGNDLLLRDTRLLLYYQNRLAAHGLAFDSLAPRGRAAA